MVPSYAVTTTVMVFAPTFRGMFLGVPEAEEMPLIWSVAFGCSVVGVMLRAVTALPTDAL